MKSRFIAAIAVLASATAFAQIDPLVVTKAVDDGTIGTLRYAINYAKAFQPNGACPLSAGTAPTIKFNITTPSTGPYTIQPATPLPAITCPNTTIDGYSQPGSSVNTGAGESNNANLTIILNGSACTNGASTCTGLEIAASNVRVQGLSIHSFSGAGITVSSGSGVLYGNYIGTDPGGMNPLPNGGSGIDVMGGQINVGSGADQDRNLITANGGAGINVGAAASSLVVDNNQIGGRRDGSSGMGNTGAGVASASTGTNQVYKSYIRYNGGAGVLMTGTNNAEITGNLSIHGNGTKGISYSGGSRYSPPRITSFVYDSVTNLTTITVQMTGGPASTLTFAPSHKIELYDNSTLPTFGEGQRYLGAATISLDTTGSGTATQTITGSVGYPTATFSECLRGCSNTTEFSLADLPPQLSLSFSPSAVVMPNTSTLTMVVSNPNKVRTISLAGFSFGLPSGLSIVGAETAGAGCNTGVSLAGASGSTAAADGITLAPTTTCTITATVSASKAGTFDIVAGTVSVKSDAGTGTNGAASLAVSFNPPTVSLGANQTIVGNILPIQVGVARTTSDPNYAGMGVTLNFPAGVTLASIPNLGSGCSASVSSTSTSISASGGSIGGATVGCGLVGAQVQFPGDGVYVFTLNAGDFQLTQPGAYSNSAAITKTVTVTSRSGTASPTSLAFGTIANGTTATLPVTVTSTGTATLSVTGVSTTGPFTASGAPCTATTPGSCTVNVTFAPTTVGTFTGQLTINTDASTTPFLVTLTGTSAPTAPALQLSPASLAFGLQAVGSTSAAQKIAVKNTGNANLVISTVVSSGDFAGGGCAGTTVAPGGTCTIGVTFTPTATGARTGSIVINSNASGSPHSVPLSGTGGAPAVQLAPASLTFGRQAVGTTSSAQNVVLTNSGTTPLNISAIAASGDFGYAGCGFPLTIAPGASCTFSVTFTPISNGTLTGSIRITSDAPGSPHAIALTGTGAFGPQPGISLRPFSLGFGDVRVGSQGTDRVTVVSNGSAPLQIVSIAAGGTAFAQTNACPASLPVGGTCDITVTFTPTALGAYTGQVTIQSNGDPAVFTVPLSGNGVPIPPAVLSVERFIDFGLHVIATTTRLALDLRNTGGQPLTVTGADVRGTGFALEGACASIAPGATCTLTLVFTPATVGTFTGSLTIASNDARGPIRVDLLGQGLAVPRPEIELSVDGIGFANQMITTQSASQSVTVTSAGSAPLHIRGIAASGPFVITGNGCAATLAPGARCQVSLGFLPLAPGFAEGRLTVDSDAEAGRGFASLTGTGCRFFSVAGMRSLQRLCSP